MLITTTAHLPLAVVAMWGEVTLDDVKAMGSFYEGLHQRKVRFATLVDARRCATPSPQIRRALAEMTHTFAGVSKLHTVSVATVLDSKVLVGVLTALRWFIKDEQPFSYHGTSKAAFKWSEAHLVAEHLVVDAAGKSLVEKLDVASAEQLNALFADR